MTKIKTKASQSMNFQKIVVSLSPLPKGLNQKFHRPILGPEISNYEYNFS